MPSIAEIIENLKDRGSTRDRNEAIEALEGLPHGGTCIIRAAQIELAANYLDRHGNNAMADACRDAAKLLRQAAGVKSTFAENGSVPRV